MGLIPIFLQSWSMLSKKDSDLLMKRKNLGFVRLFHSSIPCCALICQGLLSIWSIRKLIISLGKVEKLLFRVYKEEKSWPIVFAAHRVHPHLQGSDGKGVD